MRGRIIRYMPNITAKTTNARNRTWPRATMPLGHNETDSERCDRHWDNNEDQERCREQQGPGTMRTTLQTNAKTRMGDECDDMGWGQQQQMQG
jgi:hypothetical protein